MRSIRDYKLRYILIALAIFVVGCTPVDLNNLLGAPAREEFDHIISAVLAHDKEFLRNIAAPALLQENFDERVGVALEHMPTGNVISRTIVGAKRFDKTGDIKATDFTAAYEFHLDEGWVLFTIQLHQEGDQFQLTGLQITPQAADLETRNAFSFSNKSIHHYVFLGLMFTSVIFILMTLIFILRTRNRLKRPYAWIFISALCFGALTLNWETGQIFFNSSQIGIFGASVSHVAFSPWTLSIQLPFGALAFWVMRRFGMLNNKT